MKILIVMDPGIMIPVTGYGGHERLVEMFAKEYHRVGHDVHLLITGGSTVEGCTVYDFGKEGFPPRKINAMKAIPEAWKFIWKHRNDFDMIHNFGRLVYLLPILRQPVKKIMTYGREISSRNIRMFNILKGENIVYTACSENLLSRMNASSGLWEVVYNAIDLEKYDLTQNLSPDAPLIFLGRIEKVKGCHTAIQVAKATGSKLIIAGNISPLHDEKLYFENEILPHVDGVQIQYVGALNDTQKNHYLGMAKGLLFPIEWNEPFGIVMIEAMACGTPVIGFNAGSVPEVIDEGITGFVVADFNQMIESVKRLGLIDRTTCRNHAKNRFDVKIISKRYLHLFDAEKRIVIITSAQPSANPRVVKEATALSSYGYEVTVIYCPMSPWADDFDRVLFARTPRIRWIKAGYTPLRSPVRYTISRVRRKAFELLNRYNSLFKADTKGIFLFAPELKRKAKSIPADLYIAHHVAALPAASAASKKWNTIYSFDAEDFHRGEGEKNGYHWETTSIIESKYLPGAVYLSAASPLIRKEYQKYFPKLPTKTINNVFSVSNIAKNISVSDSSEKLKLFWFSQKIGLKRGLEDIITAIGIVNDKRVQLTLLGNIYRNDKKYFLDLMTKHRVAIEQVHFHAPVNESEIPVISSRHHIGLALEPGRDLNNQIALSNKLFIYLLSGNAVLFSSTPAQRNFFGENNGIGGIYEPGDSAALAVLIGNYLDNPGLLTRHRNQSYLLAKEKYNWEKESVKLLSILQAAIEKKS